MSSEYVYSTSLRQAMNLDLRAIIKPDAKTNPDDDLF
jgi:hypothetical protein